MKNISVLEVMCASLFRKVNNQLPGDTASRLSIKILNEVDYIHD